MKKILSVIISIALVSMLFVSTGLITASAEDEPTVTTYYSWDSSYPSNVTPTKPYSGTMSTEPPKTIGDESKPFTGTIETQQDVTPEAEWYDGMFTGTENDVAAEKSQRDEQQASVSRPGIMLSPVLIAVIAVGAALVVGAVVFAVLTLINKKKKNKKTAEVIDFDGQDDDKVEEVKVEEEVTE